MARSPSRSPARRPPPSKNTHNHTHSLSPPPPPTTNTTSSNTHIPTRLTPRERLTLLSLTGAFASALTFTLLQPSDTSAPLLASLSLSGLAFTASYALIRWLGKVFVAAGLKGRDMGKAKRPEIPETMGAVCAAVYLLTIIVFIPFVFYRDIVAATSGGGNREGVVHEGLKSGGGGGGGTRGGGILGMLGGDDGGGGGTREEVEVGRLLHRFPHSKLALYLSAIMSLQSVVILGIGDDLFDIRWRHKLFIPAISAIPMLVVYFVDFGVTRVVVPRFLQPFLQGTQLVDLGWAYYAYMAAVAIFCPNSINILAGINGIEVSQSLVIACLLVANDCLYLTPFTGAGYPHPATDSHLFSIYLLLPFIGVSLALWWHNWYPARVFVGDTYCYFAGMVFAIAGILGHFSKTLLLLFVPQIFNFLYSAPQLAGIIPCPRHRLPKFNARTGLLEISVTEWRRPPRREVAMALKLLGKLRLVAVRVDDESGEIVETSNLTLLNLWLVWFGPMREDRLAMGILAMQACCGVLGLLIRHRLGVWLFDQDNRAFNLPL